MDNPHVKRLSDLAAAVEGGKYKVIAMCGYGSRPGHPQRCWAYFHLTRGYAVVASLPDGRGPYEWSRFVLDREQAQGLWRQVGRSDLARRREAEHIAEEVAGAGTR